MKRFIVLESDNTEFIGQFFEIETQIRSHVTLPFTNEQYRCVMFNGVDIQLVNNDKIIKGTLR